MTTAFPGPATSRLTSGVSQPHPVKGGRSYLPTKRPPCSGSKPGLELSGTMAAVAVRQEPPLISVHRATRTAAMTASTVTVPDIRLWSSTPPR